jgi:hypothetical protein
VIFYFGYLKRLRKKSGRKVHLQWPQKIKYSEINLTKEIKDFYSENYKTLKKEIENDIRRLSELILWKGGITESNLHIQMQSSTKFESSTEFENSKNKS